MEMNKTQKVARVFSVILTVIFSLFLIPMAWMIPMTVYYKKHYNECGIGFGVCMLIFHSAVAGICIIVDRASAKKGNSEPAPQEVVSEPVAAPQEEPAPVEEPEPEQVKEEPKSKAAPKAKKAKGK